MKKKLLILGAGNAQIDLIEYAKKKGLEVHGLSYSNTDKGIPLLDYFEQINIVDTEAVESYVKMYDIDYIYSVGSDIAVPTFCKVAEHTNKFHFVSSETADICCNKHLMRRAFSGSEYNVPYLYCKALDSAKSADFYPFMMKPVDSQGQRGVYCVNSYEELVNYFDDSMAFSKSKTVILEKFIDGDEVSVNAYVENGKIVFFLMSDRESYKDFPGGIIKAHHLPSKYEEKSVKSKVENLVREAIERLNILNGPVYFQIKIEQDHPYLIEVTPRLDGCHMWRLIKEYCGVDLLDMTMTHFLTGEVEKPCLHKKPGAFHTEFFCQPPDTIFDATNYDKYPAVYKRLYYKDGDKIKKMNGYMEKCGYRIFCSPQRTALIGGSGLIGRCFAEEYKDRLHITDISRKSNAIALYSYEEIYNALQDCDSAVILAAKKVNAGEKQSLSLYEDNIKVVEASLMALRDRGIKNVVYISSRCVYANSGVMPLGEEAPIAPVNYYGISKYTGELLCDYYNRNFNMNVKILRLSQVLGFGKENYMPDIFLRKALCGEDLTVYGQSVGKRDYIYVKDAALGIYCALTHYAESGVFNIGSGIGTTSLELAKSIIEGLKSTSTINRLLERKEDTSVFYLDIKKAFDALGFCCRFSLTAAFEDLRKNMKDIQYEYDENSI